MLYFFGLITKCCIFKCFIFSLVCFWVQFYSLGTLVGTVLHYCHTELVFGLTKHVFGGYFRVLLSKNIFLGFFVTGKGIFKVVQKHLTPLIPVCSHAMSNPWVIE